MSHALIDQRDTSSRPRGWALTEAYLPGGDQSKPPEVTLVWHRRLGPFEVQVRSCKTPGGPGVHNVVWFRTNGSGEGYGTRTLADCDEALLESAERSVLRGLYSERNMVSNEIAQVEADQQEYLPPSMAVPKSQTQKTK